MNRFAAIACLLIFAWNLSFTAPGYASICTFVETDRSFHQLWAQSHDSLESCCSDRDSQSYTRNCDTADCSYCIEVENNATGLDEANAFSMRLVLSAPLALEYAPFVLDHCARVPVACLPTLSSQAPPVCHNASQEFSRSVRILC